MLGGWHVSSETHFDKGKLVRGSAAGSGNGCVNAWWNAFCVAFVLGWLAQHFLTAVQGQQLAHMGEEMEPCHVPRADLGPGLLKLRLPLPQATGPFQRRFCRWTLSEQNLGPKLKCVVSTPLIVCSTIRAQMVATPSRDKLLPCLDSSLRRSGKAPNPAYLHRRAHRPQCAT